MRKEVDVHIMLIKNNRIIFLFVILLFVFSCKGEKEGIDITYGTKFNDVREEIGLIPLKKDWIHLPIGDDGRIWWYDPNVDSTKIITNAYYSTKTTLVKGDTIINETDAFTSPNTYENDYGKYNVRLLYTYLFVPDEGFPVGWVYYLFAEPRKNNLRGGITKEQADSILFSWGLSYP